MPTCEGVLGAQSRIAGHATRTPLLPAELPGGPTWVKAECLQRGGAFKIRGAANRLLQLDAEERARGVVAFSSGNHAQGVARAARELGTPALIVMPADAPAVKLAATRALGAEVVLYDRLAESREAIAARIAAERGATLVPSFDDVDVIEGQGTVGLEIGEDLPDVSRVIVPCGGGGLAAGIALALPDAEVVVAEPEGWDDMARSLEAGHPIPVAPNPPPTRCDSIQTFLVSPLTLDPLRTANAQAVAVSEGEVADAMRWAFANLRLVVEPGGAAALAAALAGKVQADARTAIVLSGGNVDPALYAEIIA